MSQLTLLLIDDEVGVRESLKMVFNKDFRILEADSIEAAVQKAREERPDLVILDVLLPGTDGLQVLKQIKEIIPDCEVIILTALTTEHTALTAREHGAFDCVIKPFDIEELRLKVAQAREKVAKISA
jgi:DNA-binding response OmpR family regulator